MDATQTPFHLVIIQATMANPLTVNPSSAARHLTVGTSDWLWVVTAIMGISAVVALGLAKTVRPLLVGRSSCLANLLKATARNTGVPPYGSSRPHSVYYNVFCYGIEPGANGCQNRV
jgi:hypothetical protein